MEFTPGFFKLASGQIIGKHQGKEGFTIGQRKGLGIAWKNPLYVLAIEDDGTVILGEEEETVSESFVLEEITYQGLAPLSLNQSMEMKVQIRYRSAPVLCQVTSLGDTWKVTFLEDVKSVTPGQSATFYPANGDYLLAGGIIQKGSITRKVKPKVEVSRESVPI